LPMKKEILKEKEYDEPEGRGKKGKSKLCLALHNRKGIPAGTPRRIGATYPEQNVKRS